MSKVARSGKKLMGGRKAVKKTETGNMIKTFMKAGRAAPGPPLGPALGAVRS